MKKIAIISGGSSCEREVSLATGKQMYNHCDPEKYNIHLFDFTKEGFVLQIDGKDVLHNKKHTWIKFLNQIKRDRFDLVIIGLHGTDGEDGYIQGILEELELPFVGSDSKVSALAMDKYRAGILFQKNGIQTPLKYLISKGDSTQEVQGILEKMSGNCIVKPNSLGSSVGLYYLDLKMNLKEKGDVLEKAFVVSEELLIEEYISGREFACGILEYSSEQKEALPVIEIITGQKLFDYDAKYKNDTLEVCPAEIDKKISRKIQELALEAHNSLGCKGLSRSDFILDSEGRVYILETNTLPGMTQNSLFPKEFIATGRTFEDLMDIFIKKALS